MAQRKRKTTCVMKEEMIMEEQFIPEVLVDLIDTIQLLNQQESFMHLNIP
jgi:hypothetical protein